MNVLQIEEWLVCLIFFALLAVAGFYFAKKERVQKAALIADPNAIRDYYGKLRFKEEKPVLEQGKPV